MIEKALRLLFLAVAAVAVVAAAAGAPPAAAMGHAPCGRALELELKLAEAFDEALVAVGTVRGLAMRLYLSGRGTWTMAVIDGRGQACILAMGGDFEVVGDARPAGEEH